MELQMKGIQSLITYAARSDFVLIPVEAKLEESKAFAIASQPSQLLNYGERAWCRLETYIFMCLADITGKEPHVYGYGQASFKSRFMCFSNTVTEVLRSLANGTGKASQGAQFGEADMPSSGKLTVEKDRDVIRRIEEDVRTCYTQTAILSEVVGYVVDYKKGFSGKREKGSISLQGKQLADDDIEFLHDELGNLNQDAKTRTGILRSIKSLNLSSNFLAVKGINALGQICDKDMLKNLALLDLSHCKRFGTAGLAELLGFLPKSNISTPKLVDCDIGNTMAVQISAGLSKSRKLRNIHLDDNRIGSNSGSALLNIFKTLSRNAVSLTCKSPNPPLGQGARCITVDHPLFYETPHRTRHAAYRRAVTHRRPTARSRATPSAPSS